MNEKRAKFSGEFSFRDLQVWKESISFTKELFGIYKLFPAHEQYGLCGQMRRAARSVGGNIAEGWGRGPGQALINHIRIARGSLFEVVSDLELAFELGYIQSADLERLIGRAENLCRLLNAFANSLQSSCVREGAANYGQEPVS